MTRSMPDTDDAQTQVTPDDRPMSSFVDAAIRGRYAVRAFFPTPVSRAAVRDILDVARFAPSGANTQPWRVHTLAGAVKETISSALVEAFTHAAADHKAEYDYYPTVLPEPYGARRGEFGRIYYGALKIEPGDLASRAAQTAKNFTFFGAPVGLIFTIDRRLSAGSWLDFGMFLQNIMIAARGRGLATCPQETFARFHEVLRRHLPIARNDLVVCGMSLGYGDHGGACGRGLMPKGAVDSFATFHGFAEPHDACAAPTPSRED